MLQSLIIMQQKILTGIKQNLAQAVQHYSEHQENLAKSTGEVKPSVQLQRELHQTHNLFFEELKFLAKSLGVLLDFVIIEQKETP